MAGKESRPDAPRLPSSCFAISSLQASLQHKKQLNAFAASTAKIGAGMSAGAVGVIAPITAAVKSFADAGSAIDDISQRTGPVLRLSLASAMPPR